MFFLNDKTKTPILLTLITMDSVHWTHIEEKSDFFSRSFSQMQNDCHPALQREYMKRAYYHIEVVVDTIFIKFVGKFLGNGLSKIVTQKKKKCVLRSWCNPRISI